MPLSGEIVVAALAVTTRPVLETILQKLASSSVHHVPAKVFIFSHGTHYASYATFAQARRRTR